MIIRSAAITHIGNVRQKNEDNFYINKFFCDNMNLSVKALEDLSNRRYHTFAVCDGMGGANYGEIASLTALKVLRKFDGKNFPERFDKYVREANRAICEISRDDKIGKTGTTIAVMTSDGRTANICNVGDSRIYRFRGGILEKLSKDHTQIQDLIDIGVISEHEASVRNNHILTQHLGIEEDEFIVEAYIKRDLLLVSGDVYLLCSDGLTDMLNEDCISGIIELYKNSEPKVIVSELLTHALEKGGKDNITMVVVRVY